MTSEKKEKIDEMVAREQRGKIKGMFGAKPPNYRENFPDGGAGHYYSRHYDDPVKPAKEEKKEERVTTEKGIEEMQNER